MRLSPDYDLRFAGCRELGHAWFIVEQRSDGKGARRICRCDGGCGTVRIQEMVKYRSSFKIDRYRYRYPKGYVVKDINALDLALEVRSRLMKLAQEQKIRWLGGKWTE